MTDLSDVCRPLAPEPLIDWLCGVGTPPFALQGERWLLAHLDDGVTWGELRPRDVSPSSRSRWWSRRRHEEPDAHSQTARPKARFPARLTFRPHPESEESQAKGAADWRLGSQAFPSAVPELRLESLRELRVFGPNVEHLVWRSGDGLQGRTIADPSTAQWPDGCAPYRTSQVVLGDRIFDGPVDGFTLVGRAGGSQHAVPVACPEHMSAIPWPLRLSVVHYLESDAKGCVSVVASRLASLTLTEKRS